jgi:prolipoprotein diacylglyceryltransferase
MWPRIGPVATYGLLYLAGIVLLYEVGLMLIILLVFSQLKSDRWQGTRLFWFPLLYGVGRAATDFLRGDTEGPLYLGLLSLTQVLSLAAAAAALILLVAQAHKASRNVEFPKGV